MRKRTDTQVGPAFLCLPLAAQFPVTDSMSGAVTLPFPDAPASYCSTTDLDPCQGMLLGVRVILLVEAQMRNEQ